MLDKDTGSLKTSNRSASLQSLTTLLPDLVRHILNLYVRAWTFTEDKVPQLSYSDSTIRFAKLLTIINLSSGILDDDGLRRIVLNVKISRSPIAPPQLSSFLTKGELTNLLFRAFPPSSSSTDAVSIIDRTTILSGIASVLSELGYQRKKALVLRELLTGLSPALVQARKDGAAEMGFHPAASLASLDLTSKATSEQHAEINQNVLENGIQNFLALVCQIYEIPAFGPGNIHISSIQTQGRYSPSAAAEYDTQESIVSRTLEQTTMKLRGNQILKLDILRSCIDICEALPDLGGVLRFSAHMLRTAGSCIIPGPEIDVGSPALSMEEQIRLASNISRTVSTARQLGILNVEAEYWDEFLVRSVEVVDMNPSRNPTSHSKGELQVVNAIDKKELNNPFIYDPFRRSAASNLPETLLVAQEEATFRVTLQNLYDFDVDIERIKIDSIDLPFVCSYQSGMIGPYRTQAFFLTGTPRDSGSLRVVGCRVKVKGCRERSFPIFNTPWTPTSEIKIGRPDVPSIHNDQKRPLSNASDASRGKRLGAFPGPISSSIALNVIKAQPSIVMKSISLPQSAIMLLEGETVTYTVVVQNISSIPVDLLFLTFNDSTAFLLRSALANKELSPTELYELELASMRKQTFKWHRTTDDKDTDINPGMELPIQVEVLGKPGLTHGTTQIDYGYLGDSDRETAGSFYTRQLTIPITITVNASVELTRNDIVTFTSEFSWQNRRRKELEKKAEIPPKGSPKSSTLRSSPGEQNGFQALLGRVGLNPHDSDHCLLTLDLRNSWPSLISISISISSPATKENSTSESWKRAYTVHESLQPGHTTRVLLLIPRIYLPNPYAPIPSLTPATKRQYVVSSTPKPNPEIELATREAFHYREALLELIRATWEEDTTHRSGAINLRALHLTTRMVSALKLDDVDIQLSIRNPEPTSPPSPANITQLSHSTFNIPTSAFLTLTSTLTNRSPRPIHAILRLQPALQNQPHNIALDLSKKFLWSGLLQRVVGVLEPGATKVLELGFVVLCKGVFEIGGCVEEVGGRKEDAEEGGKRVWWARDGCVIVAEEKEGIQWEDQKDEEEKEKG